MIPDPPSPSPSPSLSLHASISPSLSASPSSSPSVSSSPSASPSISPSASVSPSASPLVSISHSDSSSPSTLLNVSPSASPSVVLVFSNSIAETSSAASFTVVNSPANLLTSVGAASQSPSILIQTTGIEPQLTDTSIGFVVSSDMMDSAIVSSTLQTRTVSQATDIKKSKTPKTVQTTNPGTQTTLTTRIVSKTATVPPASNADKDNLFIQAGHQQRPGKIKGNVVNLKVGAATGVKVRSSTGRTTGNLQVRDIADGSSSLRAEPMWLGLPLLNAAQLPLAQTGMNLVQQGYNRIMDWFQGKSTDKGIQIQELLPRVQVLGFLQDYNRVLQGLERIIQQLESNDSVTSNLLSWLKDSIIEHRIQGQQLVQQQIVTQKTIKVHLENIQALAQDVTEFVETLVADNTNSAVFYAKARMADVNQSLSKLSKNPSIAAKDQATLKANVKAQLQANAVQQQAMNLVQQPATMNVSTLLTADAIGLLV
jgi:hypothetical protein